MLPSRNPSRTIVFGFRILALAGCAAACLLMSPRIGGAQVLNVATGLDSSFNLIPGGDVIDPHWTVTTDPTFSPLGTAETVYPNNADWFGGWLANGPFSDWIARNADVTDNGPAPYTFTENVQSGRI